MSDDITAARRALSLIWENSHKYSDTQLRALKNSADVFSNLIKQELRKRDARMVDQACALEDQK